jgi:hypothetical protein
MEDTVKSRLCMRNVNVIVSSMIHANKAMSYGVYASTYRTIHSLNF